jgi:hypothetical protein
MPDVSRLNSIIADLERIQKDADEIINTHIDGLLCNAAPGLSWGETRHRLLAPLGSRPNYVAALRLLRDRLRGK